MGPSHHIREENLPYKFSLYMQYNLKNGDILRGLIPNWKCKKIQKQIHLKLPKFEPLNL